MKTFEEWLKTQNTNNWDVEYLYAVQRGFEAAKPRWIPVSDRLPEKHKKVLYRNNKIEPTTMTYQNVPFSRFINKDSGKWYFTDDSEWMEIPE